MKRIISVLSLIFALAVCLCCFTGCAEKPTAPEDPSQAGDIKIEDVEDAGIDTGKVTLVNLSGKDAVELLARRNGETEWRKDIFSADSLRSNVTCEVTYVKADSDIFDIRFVYEDGSTQDFTQMDFSKAQGAIYLGAE